MSICLELSHDSSLQPSSVEEIRIKKISDVLRVSLFYLTLRWFDFVSYFESFLLRTRNSLSKPLSSIVMSKQHFVLGIDGGTESIRASVFDLKGNQISCFSSAYETLYPQSSWAEQHAADWIEVCLVFSKHVYLRSVFVGRIYIISPPCM